MQPEIKFERLKAEYERKDEMGIPMSVRKQYSRKIGELKSKLKNRAHQKKLGRILLEKKLVSEEKLGKALTEQAESKEDKLIGEILLDQGLITREELEEAIGEQVRKTYSQETAV